MLQGALTAMHTKYADQASSGDPRPSSCTSSRTPPARRPRGSCTRSRRSSRTRSSRRSAIRGSSRWTISDLAREPLQAAGPRSSSTRSSSRSCATRCARFAGARACTTATCSASRSTRSRASPAGGADDTGLARRRSTRRTSSGSRRSSSPSSTTTASGAGLDEADVVLVGVSRTSKTPLSIYLGYLGHKAANVPIVKGIEPPKELFEIDRAKIVGLTIDADGSSEIRRARVRTMGGGARNRQLRRAARDLRGARAGDEACTAGSAAR